MTSKERALIKALAAGLDIEEAAIEAGYNLAYARLKAAEAKIKDAVEAAKKRPRRRNRKTKTPPIMLDSMLDELIIDATLTPSERIAAVRAKLQLERQTPEKAEDPPVIIDDLLCGEECEKYGEAGAIRLPEGAAADPDAAGEDRAPAEGENRG